MKITRKLCGIHATKAIPTETKEYREIKESLETKEYRETKEGVTTLYVSGKYGIKRIKLASSITSPRDLRQQERLEKEMVRSVTHGYKERITIHGVGYKAQVNGDQLEISLGYKTPVTIQIPSHIKIQVKSGGLVIEGWSASYRDLRQFLSTVVEIRPASKDKYTHKGIVKWNK